MGIHRLPLARFEPPSLHTMVRERVDRRLDRAWDVPLTVIVGPAGAGKTTAASHLVTRSAGACLWYRAHAVDGDETSLGAHLAQAWEHATGTSCRADHLADVLVGTSRSNRELLVVIDEFDVIIGTPSEDALGDVLGDLGPSTHLVTLSRHRPAFNLSRLRVLDAVCEVGPDDLRFRSWEVDRLFRELYRRPLLPDEVAELERRTGGWVAALHLFNMATAGLATRERRAVLAQIGRRTGPDWDFLADNVLAGLRDDLKLFLLETAPLPRLTAELCDELLETSGSWQQLEELERLQLLTPSVDSPGSYRSHEVLRSHLDGLLVEWEGADAVRKRYRRAAESLESHGRVTDALSAYCRGEDWPSARRLLGARGHEVADRPGTWLGGLPSSLLANDPWVLLALARQQRSEARLADAIATYQRVEQTALSSVPVIVARRERLLLASLLDRSSPPRLAWVGALRDAAFGDVATVSLDGSGPHEDLARGVVRLMAGDVGEATALLRSARDAPDASPALSLAAGLGHVVATYLAGASNAAEADALERAATLLEIPFLTRLCRAATGMAAGDATLVTGVVDDCDRAGDAVGGALAGCLGSLAGAFGPTAALPAADVAERCRAAGLRNVEVWAAVAGAVAAARLGLPGASAADQLARRLGGPLLTLATFAGASVDPSRQAGARALAARLAEEDGIVVPGLLPSRSVATPEVTLAVRCFGHFAVRRDGHEVDLAGLRPRARAVLRMLAVGVDGVHRHVLGDELWPDDDEAAAARKLHVAVSSIRRHLGAEDAVRRHGDVYALDASIGSDVREFEVAVADARDPSGERDVALRRALDRYRGPLLPEDTTSEWIEGRRRHLQAVATDAARQLAESLLTRADAPGAIDVCRAALLTDRYADPMWRLLLRALDEDGDPAEAARAAQEYAAVLAELGVAPA